MTATKTNERPGTRAVHRHSGMSASKARQVLDLIRGEDVQRAAEMRQVGEHGQADSAARRVGLCDVGHLGSRPDRAAARRLPLDLGDKAAMAIHKGLLQRLAEAARLLPFCRGNLRLQRRKRQTFLSQRHVGARVGTDPRQDIGRFGRRFWQHIGHDDHSGSKGALGRRCGPGLQRAEQR